MTALPTTSETTLIISMPGEAPVQITYRHREIAERVAARERSMGYDVEIIDGRVDDEPWVFQGVAYGTDGNPVQA